MAVWDPTRTEARRYGAWRSGGIGSTRALSPRESGYGSVSGNLVAMRPERGKVDLYHRLTNVAATKTALPYREYSYTNYTNTRVPHILTSPTLGLTALGCI